VDIQINGKRVTLRDKIPARLGWDIVITRANILQKAWHEIDFRDLASLLSVAVESWEFEGDPKDAASYDNLDLLTEFVPLTNQLGQWLNDRFGAPKN